MGYFFVGCLCGSFVSFVAIVLCMATGEGDMYDD